MHILLINLIELLGLVGFLIAFFIYRKKKAKKKLICPRYSNCDTVIHSDYSKILGIPVETLGMIYYLFIGSAYSLVFVFHFWSPVVAAILLGVSMCSVLFSIYLVSIQAFVVKQWCVWCLCSAFISLLIFILSYIHLGFY
jgi:uncharacterized membrane protein